VSCSTNASEHATKRSPSPPEGRPIHRSAWKKKRNSRKFAVAICPALSRTPGPTGRGEQDLALSPAPNATFGARICYKLLRLATGSTSENSSSMHLGE
jgi:hypothetical protein